MKTFISASAVMILAHAIPAQAAGDLSRANVIDVTIEMGSDDSGGMYLKPDHFDFETGQAYKLVLVNTDEIKHEIALNEMGEKVFTRKVEIANDGGNLVAEIKGTIREVEVGPKQTVEWFIVPIQTTDGPVEITCELPGHYESGMLATVEIK